MEKVVDKILELLERANEIEDHSNMPTWGDLLGMSESGEGLYYRVVVDSLDKDDSGDLDSVVGELESIFGVGGATLINPPNYSNFTIRFEGISEIVSSSNGESGVISLADAGKKRPKASSLTLLYKDYEIFESKNEEEVGKILDKLLEVEERLNKISAMDALEEFLGL